MSILFRYEKADETVLEEGFIIDPGVCEHCKGHVNGVSKGSAKPIGRVEARRRKTASARRTEELSSCADMGTNVKNNTVERAESAI